MFGNPDILNTKQPASRQPFRTNNKVGLDGGTFPQPSTQTVLPVVCAGIRLPDGTIDYSNAGNANNFIGWLSIPSTEFDGTETEFTTAEGPVPIQALTLPNLVQNSDLKYRVQQFMVAIFPTQDLHARPWLGYSSFVGASESQWSLQWILPTQGSGYRFNRGPIISDLTVRMDLSGGYVPPNPPAPSVSPGTLRWAVAMSMNDLQVGCGFIDFNWVELFQSQATYEPLKIEIVSNPASGEFKTTIVPYPTVTPIGSIEFNTLRIIKLSDVEPGAYVFNYAVVDVHGQKTPVTLTLTIV